MKHSLFCTDWELLEQLDAITGEHGTRIIIWNLRKTFNGQTEFDFDEDENDIRILVDIMNTPCKTQKTKVTLEQSEPQCKSSLRAYCSILYLEPRMEIILRGQKVITQLFSKSLSNIEKYTYKPRFLTIEKIPITFGKNAENMEQYGIMMYHKNRLIKAYERVGCQRKAGNTGVGVIGIIECNYLKTAHNKQDFDSSSEYSNTMKSLDRKVLHYWQKYCGNSSTNCPSRRILIQETHEEIHTQMRTRGQENNGLPVITSYYSLAPKRGKYISIMAPESSKSKKAKEDDTHNAVECLDATPCSSNSTDSPPRPHCSSMASQTEVRSPIKQESLSERKLICQMQDLKMTFQELTEMRRVQFQMLEKNKPDAGRSQAAGSLSDVGRREAEKPQELLQEVEKQWKVLEAAKKHFKATMTNWTS
ncbi:MORC family CW-type zinc finger protein 3 [Amia ocellicauda]|uniref:MORC family CW-type zinc finger protein 3 n=1 Tax=Amia ocellicauda TaxID=2972642 RepID=UPI003464B796